MRALAFFFILSVVCACGSPKFNRTVKVTKPVTHKVWKKGHTYVIDIRLGVRHIHLFKRRKTRRVMMK